MYARTIYFCFHYQRDIMRVQVVKNHHVTKGSYTAAGFFDGSLDEKAKKEGDEVVKRLIDGGMKGSTVSCVLIGSETYTRRWVQYEILKSVEHGMGLFGIRIHQISDPSKAGNSSKGKDPAGANPFDCLGYGRKGDKLNPMVHYQTGWQDAPYQSLLRNSAAAYLANVDKPILSSLFSVYDWVNDDGYNNFETWVAGAAKQAGKLE